MMSSARREAFISKVLARLYPEQVSTHTTSEPAKEHSESGTISRPTSESCVEVAQPHTVFPSGCESKELQQEEHGFVDPDMSPGKRKASDAKNCSVSSQKIYTTSLPPDDYVPGFQKDVISSPTENSNDSEEEDCPLKKRRRRRRKKKVNDVTQSAPDNEKGLQQSKPPSQTSETGPINKNKKRKLQRKRQKERLKAAGLWKKAKADDGFVQDNADEFPDDDDDDEEQQRKTTNVVEFLQETFELFSTESKSTCADSELSSELIVEILDQIKNAAVSFSEVQHLHHLKRLLLLQDIERLKHALDSFKEHSSMPFDHSRALCCLFNYWITNILPMKAKLAV